MRRIRGLPAVGSHAFQARSSAATARAVVVVEDRSGELVLDRDREEAIDRARDSKLPARRLRTQRHDQIAVNLDRCHVRRQVGLGWSFRSHGFTRRRSSMDARGTIDLPG